jgi:hypothetical protein
VARFVARNSAGRVSHGGGWGSGCGQKGWWAPQATPSTECTKPYAPALLSVRVRDGALRSITVSTRAYATAPGARVGMTATDLRRIYGDRLLHLVGPNKNYPDGWTVRVGGRSVAFQMDERDRVTWIGAGIRVDAESVVTDVEHYPC